MSKSEMITVKEAAALAKKSEKTIRRWLSEIVNDEAHPDRRRIKPDLEEEKKVRKAKGQFTWLIDESLVGERFLIKAKKTTANVQAKGGGLSDTEIEFLRRQNERLQEELQVEREHNRSMQKEANERQKETNGRQRETNIILKSFQDRQLPSGGVSENDTVDGSIVNTETESGVDNTPHAANAEMMKQDSTRRWLPRWANKGPAIRWNSDRKAFEAYVANGE